jgi:hypothetical protein
VEKLIHKYHEAIEFGTILCMVAPHYNVVHYCLSQLVDFKLLAACTHTHTHRYKQKYLLFDHSMVVFHATITTYSSYNLKDGTAFQFKN